MSATAAPTPAALAPEQTGLGPLGNVTVPSKLAGERDLLRIVVVVVACRGQI